MKDFYGCIVSKSIVRVGCDVIAWDSGFYKSKLICRSINRHGM